VRHRHLDADEAVVLGAGLHAANLSTTFRLRKFGMSDGVTYPVSFQVLLMISHDRQNMQPGMHTVWMPLATPHVAHRLCQMCLVLPTLLACLQLEETPGTQQNENGTAYLPKPLLPFGKRLPAKRVVHLPNITSDPIRLQLLVGPPTPDAKVSMCMPS
jgi:hypothetical protein